MFLLAQRNGGSPGVTDHRERTVFLPRAAGQERTLHQGEVRLRLLGRKAGQGREGPAQQGRSPPQNKELKVGARGSGDRRQAVPVFRSSARLLPHTTCPLCRKHKPCHVTSSCAEPLGPFLNKKTTVVKDTYYIYFHFNHLLVFHSVASIKFTKLCYHRNYLHPKLCHHS